MNVNYSKEMAIFTKRLKSLPNLRAPVSLEIEQEVALIVQLPTRIKGWTCKTITITTPTTNDFIHAAGPY